MATKKRGTLRQPGESVFVPGWLPPVLYAAVTILLFRKFVFTGEMLLGQDTLSLGYVAREFYARALRGGIFPLWNPVILGGTPFLDSLAGGDSLYPTSLLLLVMEPYRALGWKLVLHIFLSGLFTFGWIRALGLSRAAALLAGLAYLLAPFMVTLVYPGHDGKIFVTALTPLLFWAVEKSLPRGGWASFAFMALIVALVILTTHFQQAYFLFGAVGIYAAVRAAILWRQGRGLPRALGRFGLFLLFSGLGAGIAAIQLLPAVDYVLDSSRRTATTTRASEEGSAAYSSSWSLHPEEAVSLVVPEFVGNTQGNAAWAENTYWGRNPFKLNHEYAGLVVLLLAGISFFGAPRKGVRLTLAGVGTVALLYALGMHTPVWRIFYEVVPGISLFRAPSIAVFLFGFGAVTLMAFGVDLILDRDGLEKGRWGPDLRLLAAVAGLLFLGTVLAGSGTLTSLWTTALYADLDEGQAEAMARAAPFITRGFFLATLLASGTLLLTWAFKRGWVAPAMWLGGIGLLVVVDLARVDDPFIQTLDFQEWATPDPNFRFLMERQAEEVPFRVLDLGGRVGIGQRVQGGMHGLDLAAGHHPNDLARYREVIGMVGSGVPMNLLVSTGESITPQLSLLSMLNVRYVIWPAYQLGLLSGFDPVMGTTLGRGQPYELVYELPTLPRARLVGEARVLAEEETVGYLRSEDFRPAEEVVLNAPAPVSLPGRTPRGEVRWLEKGINQQRFEVRTEDPALFVLAENWFPFWRATVDGEDSPVLRANHTLRAVALEPGQHEVRVFVDGRSLRWPLRLSVLSSLVVLGLGGWGVWRRRGPPLGSVETE